MDKYTYLSFLIKGDYIDFEINSGEYSYEEIFKANSINIYKKIGLREKAAFYVRDRVREIDIDREWDDYIMSGVKSTLLGDDDYPLRLMDIDDAPKALFYYGSLPSDDVRSVAVIGARNCSEYGRFMAKKISEGLSCEGINVISGMAIGIDGIAGMSALNGEGKSYGILGSGVDICYPLSNKGLYERLKKEGGVISEYPNKTPAVSRHFPRRNRIISGLADGVVIVEAKRRSGTIITVDAALSQGKDIFVVPGRATDPLSVGCNELIKQGAYLVQCAEDIFELLDNEIQYKKTVKTDFHTALDRAEFNAGKLLPEKISLERDENMVYSCLGFDPKSSNDILNVVDMDIASLSRVIVALEIKGLIREVGRNSYVRCF